MPAIILTTFPERRSITAISPSFVPHQFHANFCLRPHRSDPQSTSIAQLAEYAERPIVEMSNHLDYQPIEAISVLIQASGKRTRYEAPCQRPSEVSMCSRI